MNTSERICRICLSPEMKYKFTPIYEKENEIAAKIFLVSGIKILEFRNHIPALICSICIRELSQATKFRMKCIESEKYFKKFLVDIEFSLLNDTRNIRELKEMLLDNRDNKNVIKNEPDDIKIGLFESIDSIIVESCKNSSNEKVSNMQKDYEVEYESYEKEQQVLSEESSPSCKLCLRTFSSMHSMRDHMRVIHQKLNETDMFKCIYCDRLFKMKYYLNRHIRKAHKKTPVKEKKKKEIKEKTEDEIFKEKLSGSNCPYCNKFLTSRHSLNDHIRVKHEFINYSERFLCDICGKDFPLKYYLIRHIKASHLKTLSYKRKKTEAFPCSICGKILKNKGNLSTHEKTHKIFTADDYYYCDLCGNKFKGRGEMGVHIKKRHLYNINYPCELCPGRSWRTLFQLQRHIKVFHHNIREFKCEWCGKEFGEKNKLICHTRIHTGEQPFHCSWENCDRKFTHQTDLRRHFWGHTGQRPYRCEIPNCMKGFMKRSELLAHENRCHRQQNVKTAPSQFEYQNIII